MSIVYLSTPAGTTAEQAREHIAEFVRDLQAAQIPGQRARFLEIDSAAVPDWELGCQCTFSVYVADLGDGQTITRAYQRVYEFAGYQPRILGAQFHKDNPQPVRKDLPL